MRLCVWRLFQRRYVWMVEQLPEVKTRRVGDGLRLAGKQRISRRA
jgi:hypothetical protein